MENLHKKQMGEQIAKDLRAGLVMMENLWLPENQGMDPGRKADAAEVARAAANYRAKVEAFLGRWDLYP